MASLVSYIQYWKRNSYLSFSNFPNIEEEGALKCYTKWPSRIFSWNAKMIQHVKIDQWTKHIDKMKEKKHMIISIDSEEACDKIKYPFMINAQQMSDRQKLPQYNKCHIWIIHNGCHAEYWKTINFPFEIRKKARMPDLPLPVNIVLEVLARSFRQE